MIPKDTLFANQLFLKLSTLSKLSKGYFITIKRLFYHYQKVIFKFLKNVPQSLIFTSFPRFYHKFSFLILNYKIIKLFLYRGQKTIERLFFRT